MGIVGKFIDAVCDTHPRLMRAVLERPLSPLERWIEFDKSGQACGCLIGTVALAAGFNARSDPLEAPYFVRALLRRRNVYEVGAQVADISRRFARPRHFGQPATSPASDARTVHLLRQRIARQLAIRESALPISALLPNEPVEAVMSTVPAP